MQCVKTCELQKVNALLFLNTLVNSLKTLKHCFQIVLSQNKIPMRNNYPLTS